MGSTTLGDRFTVLSVSVVYRGSAIPVAWKVLPGNVKHPWKGEWLALLDHLRQVVEPHRTVLVMTDRGLFDDQITFDGERERTIWSYNQGVMVGANALLYRATRRPHAHTL